MHAATPLFAFLQAPTYSMSDGQFHTLLWFTGLIALWLFIQAIALAAVAYMVVKLLKTVNELTTRLEAKALAIVDRAEGKVYPLVDQVQVLVNDSVPKIKRVTENIAETTDVYRAKLAEVDALITDTTQKVKKQSDELDRIVTSTLHKTGDLVGRVEHAVLAPVRQGSALISGIKTAAERLVENFRHTDHARRAEHAEHTPRPVAFEGESVYTGLEDDYHA